MRRFFHQSKGGTREQQEQPQAAPPPGGAATTTDGGAQEGPQEASTKDSTSKSEPKPEPKPDLDPDPTTTSASKDVDAALKEFDDIDPRSPIAKRAVDTSKFLGIGRKESDEVRAESRKERDPHNATVYAESIMLRQEDLQARPPPTGVPNFSVVVAGSEQDMQTMEGNNKGRMNTLGSADDTRNRHTSDSEHAGCCIVCGFRLL
ncbi:hypothetical protein EDD17DRAFT_1530098 [Pisolithus thermaeus]|nr:hypothetical protein EDD17DRAFT_1530098 [Pisolithus thermaeus]